MNQKNSHASVCELKISTNSYPEDFTTKTVSFFPLFGDNSTTFHFEACHKKVPNVLNPISPHSVFDLVLKIVNKQHSPDRLRLLEMSVFVQVYYSDGSLFKEYEPKTKIKVEQVDSVTFESVTSAILVPSRLRYIPSEHHDKMKNGALNIVCKIAFAYPNVESYLFAESSSNFTSNFKSAYESGLFHDFVLNVGDKSFPAHKFVLVAHSPVFMKMLTQDFQESKTNETTITDTTPETFEMFLKYLYTGQIGDKSWPSVKNIYCLADKYDVGVLKSNCNAIAVSLMSLDLVCEILKLAYTYDDSNLKPAAKNFAVSNLKELISREDWKDLVATHPIIGYEVVVSLVPT